MRAIQERRRTGVLGRPGETVASACCAAVPGSFRTGEPPVRQPQRGRRREPGLSGYGFRIARTLTP